MAKRKVYLISFDAFGYEDVAFASKLPNFKRLLDKGTWVKKVQSTYPSLTYVAHTSIMTGLLPLHHQIVNNTKIQPERHSPDWHWYAKEVQGETLYDVFKRAGYKTASLLWPVMGRNKSIDYNLAEIIPNRPWQNQAMVSLAASSIPFLLKMEARHGHKRDGIQQPALDYFLEGVLLDTIRDYNPDFVTAHFLQLDSMRHHYGVNSEQAKQAIIDFDGRLGRIIRLLEDMGQWEDCLFVLVGDHYQLNTHTVVRPNHLLSRQSGWQTLGRDGTIKSWQVYCKGADGCAYIYRKPGAKITVKEILDTLRPMMPMIETVYTAQEAADFGADPNCLFMIEAKKGYYFLDDLAGDFQESVDNPTSNAKLLHATHGYHPARSHYATTAFYHGPDVKVGHAVETGRLIDHAPTILSALKLNFHQYVDGNVLYDIFR